MFFYNNWLFHGKINKYQNKVRKRYIYVTFFILFRINRLYNSLALEMIFIFYLHTEILANLTYQFDSLRKNDC